jgi:hypothetical protein
LVILTQEDKWSESGWMKKRDTTAVYAFNEAANRNEDTPTLQYSSLACMVKVTDNEKGEGFNPCKAG